MVQGIAFLSKKSWHTKNLANQEKVWMAEQRKAAEESKTKELAKQIQQEREREELDRLAGKKTAIDRGIDWMYTGQAATGGANEKSELEQEDAANRAEEFLLGKEYNGGGEGAVAAAGDFAQASGVSDGVNAVVKLEDPNAVPIVAVGAATGAEATVAERNEAFRQRVEDPMFMVTRKELEKKTEARKQKALYERVLGPMDNDDDEKYGDNDKRRHKKKRSRKSERKEERRRRKEEKKRKRHDNEARYDERKRRRRRDDSSDDDRSYSSSDDKYRRDRLHRRKRDKYYSSDDSDQDSRRRHDRHSTSRRHRSRSRDREEDRDRKLSRRHDSRRRRSRSRSPEEKQRHGRHGRDEPKQHHTNTRSHHHDDRHQHSQYYRRENQNGGALKRAPDGAAKKAGYGLQGANSSSNNNKYSPKDLGPAQDLLKQKRQTVEEERRRVRERASSRRTMTVEERAQALQEMQATAEAREKLDTRRPRDYDDDDEDAKPYRGNASFIKDMTEQAHGIKGNHHQTLSERMAQNRNTQQRMREDDAFL